MTDSPKIVLTCADFAAVEVHQLSACCGSCHDEDQDGTSELHERAGPDSLVARVCCLFDVGLTDEAWRNAAQHALHHPVVRTDEGRKWAEGLRVHLHVDDSLLGHTRKLIATVQALILAHRHPDMYNVAQVIEEAEKTRKAADEAQARVWDRQQADEQAEQ